ncbi:hypothetical protein FHU41_000142 [Psychromicrobium silvestre]|uniref:DUF2071 domain-containing protein n=1 Tax=Psychromicrobium silvestre TaxID=1645614 RepID=A0A7Y9S596_9MICC|nr:DUF2071 domain-containing protein [Psychromicrobium silvestre]NYE93921.1 hypothetical protein [Psychromicrobium silvestre]
MALSLESIVERRLLINYRLDPALARRLLPSPFRPQLVRGEAVAGICLIRLGSLRPTGLPQRIGWRAENSAHRIAVEWDGQAGPESGVFILQRHSGSWLPVLAGGRLFPGVHQHANFKVSEKDSHFKVQMSSRQARIKTEVALGGTWRSELFSSPEEASQFFQQGCTGWSPARQTGRFEDMKLQTDRWRTEPGEVLELRSSFFEALPTAAVALDSALVMRHVPVSWSAPEALPVG